MAYSPFVPLRVFSSFTMLEGAIEPKAIAKAARERGFPAIAVADRNGLYGVMAFGDACKAAGIQPIVGALLSVARPGQRLASGAPLIDWIALYAQDDAGYNNLCALVSAAHLGRPVEQEPHVLLSDLAGKTDGLICLTGGGEGALARLLAGEQKTAADEYVEQLEALFAGRLYIELSRRGDATEKAAEAALIELAYARALPLVATNPANFVDPQFHPAHDAMLCIAQSAYVESEDRRASNPEAWLKSAEAMEDSFSDLPEAIRNTLVIAQRCAFMAPKRKPILPSLAGDREGEAAQLKADAHAGLAERLALYPDLSEEERQAYVERLDFEVDVITQMGFPGYFLIVADFIKWAKAHDIPVGPGRGSGAGSLVAWSLTITDLDPLKLGLLFERFLNPERVSMPDFDIDFCQDNRYRVIEYVRERYGKDAVSQIATFGTMASKAVVRDVGRVLDLPYGLCDRLSKLIPIEGAKPVSLAKAYEMEPQIGEMMADGNDGESVRDLWSLAQPLEGLSRNVGMHAGGVLIAPGKLTDFCPLYIADGDDATPVSQFDKDDVEAVGLVKFDFLGLRNLTIIELALDYVQRLEGERIDLMSLGFEDPAAYQILKDANTTAIFQVESDGMKKLLKKLAPDRFEDIIAVLALYRPGPLGSGMVDDFILRKKGQQEIDYFHPDLKACLEPTYGVIVYQEQVMQISQIIGGYTLGGADMLRRAMGKKKADEMAKHRATIAEGAKQKGYDPALAEQLFDLMTKFAEYGFNKSHTAAYAVVTYHTAWLKAHHCAAFMAATMSSDLDNTDTVKIFYEDTVANGIAVLPPDVNESDYRFVPVDRKTIRYGLGAVKGVGEPAVRAILAARQKGGSFRDLFDFCERVDRRMVNRRVIEALIRAGAMDTLDGHKGLDRAQLMATVALAMEAAEQAAANAMQGGLFDMLPEAAGAAPEFARIRPWTERERLKEEKLAIGFFLSGHPFNAFKGEVRRFVRRTLAQLEASRDITMLAGVVMEQRTKVGNRGKMAFVLLDDGTQPREVTVYSEVLEANRGKIVTDEVLVVEAKVSNDEFSGGLRIIADRLLTLGEARSRFARALQLRINGEVGASGGPAAAAGKLQTLLEPFREGGCPIRVSYRNAAAEAELPFGDGWRVRPDDALLESLRAWLPPESVEVVYPA